MNKVISSALSILSFLVGILLLISSLLTYEKSLKFLLNFNQDSYIDFVLNNSQWHPYRPSIEINTLSIKRSGEESKFLEIKGLKIEFNLFSSFRTNLIESLYAKDIDLLIYPSLTEDQLNLKDLWLNVSSIKNLRIDEFSITDSKNYLDTLKGELSLMTLKSGDSRLRFSAQNSAGGNLDFRMNSIEGSKSLKDYKGYFNTSNFSLNQGMINQFCLDCPSGTLDSKIWFTLIDLKLVKFLGDIKFKLNSNFDFINSINAKIELEDSKNNIFRISSFVNESPANRAPDIFTSLSMEEAVFFIPEIELGNDKFINKFQHLFDLPADLLVKGYVSNLTLYLQDSFQLKANFEDLSFKSNELSISGLEGNFKYTPDVSRLAINTPYLQIDLGNLFNSPLIFNSLSLELDLNLIDNKVSIPKSTFKGIYKKTLIKGHVNLFPSPFDDTGDLSLKISSNDLNYLDALNLLPNFQFTKSTKSWLQNSISCGSLQEVSFIYRGPIDNQYDDSSSSFQSKGFFKEACLNINNVGIKDINLVTKINNSSFQGEVLFGDLYGSAIKGNIQVFKDNNNYKLEVKGNSEGPFSSILRLSDLNQIFDAEEVESGEHYTNFYFTSSLSSSLKFLGTNSNLELSSKIKDGNFKNNKTDLAFSDLFSSVEYDSSNGIKDGFATLKINDIPFKFDIRKGKENGNFNTQLVAEETLSAKKIFSSFDLKKEIKGSSKFKINLTLASFIKKQPFIEPEIKVSSNLEGISINLPEPFIKSKDSKVDFSLAFKPYLNKPPLLSFKYGDLFRGKFKFNNNATEGFVIAGKKKQSVSIVDGQMLLIGEVQKLDLGSLISLGIFEGEESGNFFVKDLLVQETNFSNFSLLKTRFKSSRTKDGIEYKFLNDDLSGRLLIPEENNKNLSFKFDFIKINQSFGSSKDSFLSLFNGIKDKFNFSTEEIFFNDQNYGNWKFSILPETNQLTLHDIKGTYGRWGLKNTNDGISTLTISKNPIGWTSSLKTNIYSGSPEKAMMQIGIKPNFELDKLSLDVDLNWNNLPWLFDYNSIKGEVKTNLEGITIRNSETLETTNNLLRLVNIFNITDSFEKATNLDFRKLYKRGFSADSVTGKFNITNKSLQIKEPILLKSGSSQFSWTGEISRDKKGNLDKLNLEVVMTLPLREYLPAYALVLGGPLTAGVVYIAGKAFEKNLDKLSSGKWIIKGNISEPKTEFDGWFEDSNKK